jgi:hypothetical protein
VTVKELPARGWVQAGDTAHCDVCGRRVWTWDLHHLVPIAWGGSDSRLLTDHQVVWVKADGDCHATVHMILDKARKAEGWPVAWLEEQAMPHLVAETARRGWNGWKKMTLEGAIP